MPVNRKKALSLVLVGLTVIGIVFLAVPFVSSLSISAKSENESWTGCNVSRLSPGTQKKCGYAMVYRRTTHDIATINNFINLLQDPGSIESKQPEFAQNEWRSVSKDFFVYLPYAPQRKCGISIVEPNREVFRGHPEYEALMTSPYFWEGCDGRAWDMSGRLYKREHYPLELNLIVPNYKWLGNERILIQGK